MIIFSVKWIFLLSLVSMLLMKINYFSKTSTNKFVLVWVMVSFTLNTIAASAMQSCHQSKANQVSIAPCHEIAKTDIDEINVVTISEDNNPTAFDQEHLANCNPLLCDDCQMPTQASLLNDQLASELLPSDLSYPARDEIHASILTYGIDYPP